MTPDDEILTTTTKMMKTWFFEDDGGLNSLRLRMAAHKFLDPNSRYEAEACAVDFDCIS